MNDPVALKTVEDFALKSETDLQTALLVAEAVPGMKERIVTEFLQELRQKLVQEVPKGWEVEKDVPSVFGPYSKFRIWQAQWKESYSICLESHLGKEAVIGVWRNGDEIRGDPNPEMLERFLKDKCPGKANRWWEWYQRVPSEYGQWLGIEALVKMRFKTRETLEYFASRMRKAAEVAAPLLNQMTMQ
jgi:hypothetical protein